MTMNMNENPAEFVGFPPYAYSHESPSRPLWDADDMRDYAVSVVNNTIGRFEKELEKQRMHFFKLEDPRAESIYNTLAVLHESLKAAINPTDVGLQFRSMNERKHKKRRNT